MGVDENTSYTVFEIFIFILLCNAFKIFFLERLEIIIVLEGESVAV